MEQIMPWRRALGASFVFHFTLFLLLALGSALCPAPLEKEAAPLELALETSPQPAVTEAAAASPTSLTAALPSPSTSAAVATASPSSSGVVQTSGDLGEVTATPAAASGGEATAAPSAPATGGRGNVAAPPTSLIRPQVLQRTAPEYPAAARSRGEEGTVLLKVEILPNGRTGDISIARSSGSSLLDEAARQAVASWRFTPAKDAATGRTLACVSTLPVSFRLQGGS